MSLMIWTIAMFMAGYWLGVFVTKQKNPLVIAQHTICPVDKGENCRFYPCPDKIEPRRK